MTLPSSGTPRGGARAVVLPGVLLGVLLLSACGASSSDSSPSASSSSTGTATASGSGSATPSGSASDSSAATSGSTPSATVGTPAATPTSAAGPTGPPTCATSALRAGIASGDGAAGSTYYQVRLTNTSKRPCTVHGFGGVSFVTSPHGDPLGAPADRVRHSAVHPVVLAPGRTASATLQQVEAGNYPTSRCRPVQATGLRIYPPDQTASVYVAHRATACRAAGVHLLSLTPYTTG